MADAVYDAIGLGIPHHVQFLHTIAMELLADAAIQGAFTPTARRCLEQCYAPVVDDVPGRITDVLDVLVHDGYLEDAGDDGFSLPVAVAERLVVCALPRSPCPAGPAGAHGNDARGAPMNEAHGRPIRKFNPGTLQSDDEVVRQFVVRHRELDLVLDVLRGNLDSSSCQHLLIVAPRGRGKTMLLARVGAELRTNADLAECLLPVRFMEESQEIFTMADFWIESLFYLAPACAHAGDAEHARELLATHGDLAAQWSDGATEERAHAAVLEAADRLGRRLVLMVENLQALSAAVDEDFGWKLRKTLQAEPQIVLFATATSRFKGLDDAAQPFFEQFRIVDLEPLDTDECRHLWHMVSGDVGRRSEIEPLRILTGGSPRLLTIVAELARHTSLRQLLEDLVTLIDNHTEYFRGHLDVLAKTERRVCLAVIDLWQPSSTAEIAARARMDVRTVSALLGRLVDRGAVLVEGTGRKRRYAAAERLYSIYYKLRRERGEAAIVRLLIQFMTVFYSQRGETEAELSAYDAVVERFGASDRADLQRSVAAALVATGDRQVRIGRLEEALQTIDDVQRRCGAFTDDAPVAFRVVAGTVGTGARAARSRRRPCGDERLAIGLRRVRRR